MGNKSKIFWDQEGYAYVTDSNTVYSFDQGVCLKCHDVGIINKQIDAITKKSEIQKNFGIHKGFKFDHKGHSWLYMSGYISLSFSYMTFVINKAMETKVNFQNDDFIFDVE